MEFGQLGRVLGAFLLVIGLMYGIAWVVRRLKLDEKMQGKGRSKGGLTLEETLYLDAKRRLVVVGHYEARHLVLLSPNGDTLLSTSGKRDEDHEV